MKAKTLVLVHPSRRTVAVKHGFSWPAFFLGPLWALVKRLWLHFGLLLAALLPIIVVDEYAEHLHSPMLGFVAMTLYLAYMLICGYFGNRWLRATLRKRGYAVSPTTMDDADRRP